MERFDELLFEVTYDTIRKVFGEPASELIYTLMERQLEVKHTCMHNAPLDLGKRTCDIQLISKQKPSHYAYRVNE